MSEAPSPPNPVEALSSHPRVDELAALVLERALDAAASRRTEFASRWAGANAGDSRNKLAPGDAQTDYGNVCQILERGVENPDERMLMGVLLALGASRARPDGPLAVQALACNLVWLAAHTPCNALDWLDSTFDEGHAAPLWDAIARVAQAPARVSPDFDQTEALIAAAALCRSSAEAAYRVRLQLAQRVEDPVLGAVLRGGSFGTAELNGELTPPPLGPALTALLAFTLILFAMQLVRLTLRYAFAYRRPARVLLGESAIEIVYRSELMGKLLRERSVLVPFSNLARITREVRYARLGLYAGLTALALGTYFGMGLFVDGLRVPGSSPPLLGMAFLCIVAGLILDFVLSSGASSARGQCRIVIVPQSGRALAVTALEPVSADALLTRIADMARSAESTA